MRDHHGQPGVLAIWNDCKPGGEADFEFWLQSEHLAERLAVPGFRQGRRHEAISGSPNYFIFYKTETPDVLTSDAYKERLNDPTPLTTKAMSELFQNMNRTVCRVAHSVGTRSGAFSVTARLLHEPDVGELTALLSDFDGDIGIAGGEIWLSAEDEQKVEASEEEILRGGDAKIAGCLYVETLRLDDARRVANMLGERVSDPKEIGIYQFICEQRSTD